MTYYDVLHKFVTVYLDDVCIYSRTLEEHLEHLRLVLQRFKEEGLKLRLKKCFFGLQDMEYLGYNVSASKISVSTKKVEAVADWPVPKTQEEVRSFVHFCNFYARFIHHFSDHHFSDGLTAEVPATEGYADAYLFGSL
jgi:hypothetical protein